MSIDIKSDHASTNSDYSISIPATEPFTVTLTPTSHCYNCVWEPILPTGVVVTESPSAPSPLEPQSCILYCTKKGTFELRFYYRRGCCGRPVIQVESVIINSI